ncbi:MAG: 5'/3'-nucleotidase SurE [Gemmatimonadota bacterium]|nr:5'/3'-nucleotidase SurE [Gemmatimonadota bacterium]
MRILCTNDDGYLALGLRVLSTVAGALGTVTVVAPDRERSATSNSLTIHRPLRSWCSTEGAMVVDGTPTDCVILAVNEVMKCAPDLCLSGINQGSNMGEDVLYSGTVAGAMEAAVMGIPAIAISYAGNDYEEIDRWKNSLTELLGSILDQESFPRATLFNINLPPIDPKKVKGVRVTSLGQRRYSDTITKALDPSGREYFWIGGGKVSWSGAADSDFEAIQDGYVSVTPVHFDLTNYRLLEEIRGWRMTLKTI